VVLATGKQDEVVVVNHGRFYVWLRSCKGVSRMWNRRPIVEPPLLTLIVCGSGGFQERSMGRNWSRCS
jgi:hypothetical protein